MIRVTRFNGSELVVNAALIEVVEGTPDTVITLVTGKKVVVREPVDDVIRLVTEYYQKIGLMGLQVGRIRGEQGVSE
ncbi:flagellar FlbD family protein [Effusibacillus dendaii]|uniref:Flagellar protein FlbD n=1 Tax=Effusibacillus dendaii TaxID=2743772 RepID=A0A7I8D576_9BACL|nr:flagellar FlbD family protein [Effusibacillus dendaii]BCJ85268.1 hypothetical protein skT53_02530 [Effusibacillus dendaii]